jgi:hypothetical protein
MSKNLFWGSRFVLKFFRNRVVAIRVANKVVNKVAKRVAKKKQKEYNP